MSTRDQYVQKMKKQLDDLNGQIDKLGEKAKVANAELRAKYDKQMAELRKLSRAAHKKMEEIKDSSEDKWEALVAEGDKIQKAFVHSFNYFKSQLK
jgi:predicted  nucleic acid-binding Zn-ribbon protein